MIEKQQLEKIRNQIKKEFPAGRYPFREWNKCEASITITFVLENYDEMRIKSHIKEMQDHNKKVGGTLREDCNLTQEKFLNMILNNDLDGFLKYAKIEDEIECS